MKAVAKGGLSLLFIGLSALAGASSIPDLEQESKWKTLLYYTAGSNTIRQGDYSSDRYLSVDFVSRYTLNEDYTLGVIGGAYQQLVHSRNNYLLDTQLEFRRINWLSKEDVFSTNYQFRIYLPTNETSEDQRKYTGFRAGLPTKFQLSTIGLNQWELLYWPRVTRYVYERKNPENGGKNFIEYNQIHTLYWSGPITDKFSFSLEQYVQFQKPFDQDWREPKWGYTADLAYEMNDDLSFSLGYSNTGAIYSRERGQDEFFDLYDKKSSEIYLMLSTSF